MVGGIVEKEQDLHTLVTFEQLKEKGCPDCGCLDLIYEQGCLFCSQCSFFILDDNILGWITGKEKCRVCGNEGYFVAPSTCDFDTMECSNCGNRTSEKI